MSLPQREGGLLQPPIVDTDNSLVPFQLCHVARLFPIRTDMVTPPVLTVVFIMLAQIDRFTTKRTNALRLLHLLHSAPYSTPPAPDGHVG